MNMNPLLLLLILVSLGCAEETGLFGPIDRPGAPGTFSVSLRAMLVSYERDEPGKSQFRLWNLSSDKDGSTGAPITKEQFTKCYHLASKVIREFRRTGHPPAAAPETDILLISGGIESLSLSYDAAAIKDNRALADLLEMLGALAKAR